MAEVVRLLSQLDLAKRWRKAPRKIRAWTRAGQLPTFTDPESGRIMYPLAAIEEWERSGGSKVAS